jgi:outer membrane receptor protein involved in Fe transport
VPHPAETGFAFATLNDYDQRDIGAYTQATYRPAADLKLVLGGRYDDNKVRDTLGSLIRAPPSSGTRGRWFLRRSMPRHLKQLQIRRSSQLRLAAR